MSAESQNRYIGRYRHALDIRCRYIGFAGIGIYRPIPICQPWFIVYLQVSVYTPPEQIEQARFALQASADVLEYYEVFFGQEYPLPKQG